MSENCVEIKFEYYDLYLHFTVKHEDMFNNMLSESSFEVAHIFPNFGNLSTDYAIRDAKVQNLIHRKDLHFDLIINEDIYQDALLAFGHKFDAPIVGICKF